MRKMRRKEVRSVNERESVRRREYRAIAFLLVFGLTLWFAESSLDLYVIYVGERPGPLMSSILSHKVFMPLMGIVCFIGYSLYITKILSNVAEAETELHESEERYRLLTENSLTGIYIVQRGKFVFVNDRLAELVDSVPEELIGREFLDFVHPDDRDRVTTVYSLLTPDNPHVPRLEFRIVTATQRAKWVEVLGTTMNYQGSAAHMGNVADVTLRKRAESEREELITELTTAREGLRFQASHDGLTGLWNRTAILDHLERTLVQGTREQRPVTVIMTDLDYFKAINDQFGHQIGDAVLVDVAKRITTVLRPYDLVGRYGGEEILIVLPGCHGDDALHVAERIRLSVSRRPIHTSSGPIRVTISLGAASSERGEEIDLAGIIAAADQAMYKAKNSGRNRVECLELDAGRDKAAGRVAG